MMIKLNIIVVVVAGRRCCRRAAAGRLAGCSSNWPTGRLADWLAPPCTRPPAAFLRPSQAPSRVYLCLLLFLLLLLLNGRSRAATLSSGASPRLHVARAPHRADSPDCSLARLVALSLLLDIFRKQSLALFFNPLRWTRTRTRRKALERLERSLAPAGALQPDKRQNNTAEFIKFKCANLHESRRAAGPSACPLNVQMSEQAETTIYSPAGLPIRPPLPLPPPRLFCLQLLRLHGHLEPARAAAAHKSGKPLERARRGGSRGGERETALARGRAKIMTFLPFSFEAASRARSLARSSPSTSC